MKTQKITSLKAATLIIGITILAPMFLTVSCNSKEGTQNNAAAQTKVKPPQIDIHTAVLTENLEALQQHIAAGSNLNEKDPFGGSSPLITASVFGKTDEARVLIDAGADLNFQNND